MANEIIASEYANEFTKIAKNEGVWNAFYALIKEYEKAIKDNKSQYFVRSTNDSGFIPVDIDYIKNVNTDLSFAGEQVLEVFQLNNKNLKLESIGYPSNPIND